MKCLTLTSVLLLVCLTANAQQPVTPTPLASYLAFEAVGIDARQIAYRPSVGFRASGGFGLPASLYLRQEFETVNEFKVASGEGRSFLSRTTVERNLRGLVSGLAGLDISHFGNPSYSKTAVRARAGASAAWLDPVSRMPRVRASVAAIVPVSDQNKLWGFKTTADGFYNFPHSFIGVTGGAEVMVANVKDSFTPRRGWAPYYTVHGGVFVNLSAISGH
jgi:hypothetical protein